MLKAVLSGAALVMALGVAACDGDQQQATDPAPLQTEQQATTPGAQPGMQDPAAAPPPGDPAAPPAGDPAAAPPPADEPPPPPGGGAQ